MVRQTQTLQVSLLPDIARLTEIKYKDESTASPGPPVCSDESARRIGL